MQNGICLKCGMKSVFVNDRGTNAGLLTGDGHPMLNIIDNRNFWPDVSILDMDYYVCQNCGYFEMFVRDKSKLSKLNDATNWRKIL